MPRRCFTAAFAVVAVLVLPAIARAATYEVHAGADQTKGEPKQSSSNAFFPHGITIHVGDVVRWDFHGFHTVTFPQLGAGGPPPLAVLATDLPVGGVNDAAGNPFWFNGSPNVVVNPLAITGSANKTWNRSKVFTTGLPLSPKPKPLHLRFNRRGSFTYYCMVHPGMKGTVRVVAKSTHIATPAATDVRRERQIAAYVRASKRLSAAPPPATAAPTVQVGRTTSVFALYRMFPASLTVNAGQPVTFTMAGEFTSEIHTVTFGPEKVRASLEKNFISPLSGAPKGTLALSARGIYPSDQPPLPAYDGANHGDGFFNTGVLDNDPASPFPTSAQITFTKPGTYHYECVIHEHMDGTIVVR
jgi:plastocyanin